MRRQIRSGGWPRACPLPCALWMVACGPEKGDADTAPDPGTCVWTATSPQADPLTAIWVSEDGTATALAYDGLLQHAGGVWSWIAAPEGDLQLVGLVGTEDALWVRSQRVIYRYDGAWTDLEFPESGGSPEGIFARADGRVVVWGSPDCDDCEGWDYLVSTLDGSTWSTERLTLPSQPLRAAAEVDGTLVLVGDDGGIYAEGEDGWTALDGQGVWMQAAIAVDGTLVAVGAAGQILRGPLDALEVLETDPTQDLIAVGAEPDGDLWALNGSWDGDIPSVALHISGDDWSAVDTGADTLWALGVVGEDAVLLAGNLDGTLLLRGGQDGFVAEVEDLDLGDADDLWVDADGALYVPGYRDLRVWSGGAVTSVRLEENARYERIDGQGAVVGLLHNDGLAFWDGVAARTVAAPDLGASVSLWDLSLLSDGSAIVVGRSRDEETEAATGLAWRVAGDTWTALPDLPAGAEFRRVAARSATEIYAGSSGDGRLYQGDGSTWTALGDAFEDDPAAILATEDAVYLGLDEAEGSALLRWDGVTLAEVPGGPPRISGLARLGDGLLVSGWDADRVATVWRWDGATWSVDLDGESPPGVGAGGGLAYALGDGTLWSAEGCE